MASQKELSTPPASGNKQPQSQPTCPYCEKYLPSKGVGFHPMCKDCKNNPDRQGQRKEPICPRCGENPLRSHFRGGFHPTCKECYFNNRNADSDEKAYESDEEPVKRRTVKPKQEELESDSASDSGNSLCKCQRPLAKRMDGTPKKDCGFSPCFTRICRISGCGEKSMANPVTSAPGYYCHDHSCKCGHLKAVNTKTWPKFFDLWKGTLSSGKWGIASVRVQLWFQVQE